MGSPEPVSSSSIYPLAVAQGPLWGQLWLYIPMGTSMSCKGTACVYPWSSPWTAGESVLLHFYHLLLSSSLDLCSAVSMIFFLLLSHSACSEFCPFTNMLLQRLPPCYPGGSAMSCGGSVGVAGICCFYHRTKSLPQKPSL